MFTHQLFRKQDSARRAKPNVTGGHLFRCQCAATTTNRTGHPRITYPEDGGGTNTGFAVEKLADIGFSAGVFAMAQTFEHLPTSGRAVECSMWDGEALTDDIECPCGKYRLHYPKLYVHHPITGFTRDYSAGSECFFFSTFDRWFATHMRELDSIYDGRSTHLQLGAQSVLLHLSRKTGTDSLYGKLLDQPSRLAVYAPRYDLRHPTSSRGIGKAFLLYSNLIS